MKTIKNIIKRFNAINGWRNGLGNKQFDKFILNIRISALTLIELDIDFNKGFRLILLNVGIEFK